MSKQKSQSRVEQIVADMKRKGFNVDVVSRYIKNKNVIRR